jgi:hypothetical protein
MDNQIVAGQFAHLAQESGLPAVLQEALTYHGKRVPQKAFVEINQGPAKFRRVVIDNSPLPRVYEFYVEHELGGEWVHVLKVEAEEHQVGDLIYFVVAGLANC